MLIFVHVVMKESQSNDCICHLAVITDDMSAFLSKENISVSHGVKKLYDGANVVVFEERSLFQHCGVLSFTFSSTALLLCYLCLHIQRFPRLRGHLLLLLPEQEAMESFAFPVKLKRTKLMNIFLSIII